MASVCRMDYSKLFLTIKQGDSKLYMFREREFEPIVDWVQSKLHIDLVTCAADSHVPRAKNAIQFVKERVRTV